MDGTRRRWRPEASGLDESLVGRFRRDGALRGAATGGYFFFHGADDLNAPLPLARRMVASLPTATAHVFAGEAHLSLLCNHFGEIARALKATS